MDFLSGNKNTQQQQQPATTQQGQPKEDYVDKGTSSLFATHSLFMPTPFSTSPPSSRSKHTSFPPRTKSLAAPCPSSVTVIGHTSSGCHSSASFSSSLASRGSTRCSSTAASSLVSFPPPEQVHDSISIPSAPCTDAAREAIRPLDPLPIETPDSKPTFSFVAPTAFDFAASKSGHNVNRSTGEKITDAGRNMYEKVTGSKVNEKISN